MTKNQTIGLAKAFAAGRGAAGFTREEFDHLADDAEATLTLADAYGLAIAGDVALDIRDGETVFIAAKYCGEPAGA